MSSKKSNVPRVSKLAAYDPSNYNTKSFLESSSYEKENITIANVMISENTKILPHLKLTIPQINTAPNQNSTLPELKNMASHDGSSHSGT